MGWLCFSTTTLVGGDGKFFPIEKTPPPAILAGGRIFRVERFS
jgi:hypothetical protein